MKTLTNRYCFSIILLLLGLASAEETPSNLRQATKSVEKRELNEPDQAIFGGDIILDTSILYPWFALLYGRSGDDDAYFCGGVLIAPGTLAVTLIPDLLIHIAHAFSLPRIRCRLDGCQLLFEQSYHVFC